MYYLGITAIWRKVPVILLRLEPKWRSLGVQQKFFILKSKLSWGIHKVKGQQESGSQDDEQQKTTDEPEKQEGKDKT